MVRVTVSGVVHGEMTRTILAFFQVSCRIDFADMYTASVSDTGGGANPHHSVPNH